MKKGSRLHRKRTTIGKNFEALEFARSLGITVAINLIADPGGMRRRSRSFANGAWRFLRS